MTFDEKINALDPDLFARIRAQLTRRDKTSLLAIQAGVRSLISPYAYLEVGSYMGGSIQPYLLDPCCEHICSIDKRPKWASDDRGVDILYPTNSTERMLKNLAEIDAVAAKKITALEGDTSSIGQSAIAHPPQVCFIDGEHTDDAVLADFRFCDALLGGRGAIYFHDSAIVYNSLARIVDELTAKGRAFHGYNLPDNIFVLEIGDFPLHSSPPIRALLLDNHVGYLAGLKLNDCYRQFTNQPLFRLARKVRNWLPFGQ